MPISWPDHQYGIGPFKVNNRIGAYCVAVNRVAEAVRLRGWA